MSISFLKVVKSFFDIDFLKFYFMQFNNNKEIKPNNNNLISKTILTGNETLQINSFKKNKIEKVKTNSKILLKKFIKKPENLLKFVEAKGTKVIKADHIEKVLNYIGETEGFLLPINGINALILTIMINILSKQKVAIGLKTEPMFILRNRPTNIYFLSHQFHYWLSYKQGLPGFDESSVKNFKNLWVHDTDSKNIDRMSLNDILNLKEAIARDVEAIDFVKEFAREVFGSKNCIEKLKQGHNVQL